MRRFCQGVLLIYIPYETWGMLTRSHGFHGQAPLTADNTAFLERLNITLLQPYYSSEYSDI